ncbi:MAG TPA: hypothetical protein VK034_26655 [Enhygromyxa sp.]|nr:hypothetical protein [Enhygromyxa sp.]
MSVAKLVTRHRRWGWGSLALFALIGLLLESLHGFKLAVLVDHETRRTMWRLAHAHGAVLALVHLGFAAQLASDALGDDRARGVSLALRIATICMPAGFALGGAWYWDGDPGLGIALVPVGAVALIYACLRLWWASGE